MQYEAIKKNTVKAEGQVPKSKMIRFYNENGKGKRIMFIGNSITLHGVKPDIGWNVEWGMAASAQENDYVHIIMEKVNDVADDCAFCVAQASELERNYEDGEAIFPIFEDARNFNADIFIFRIIENCFVDKFKKEAFKEEIKKFFKYLKPDGEAEIIFTTGFWKHPGDEAIKELAEETEKPLVILGDLGEQDEMKAIGLFEHSGVAGHPGDLGMKNIAERIFEVLKNIL